MQDLPDECQRSVEDLVILQAESAELHQNIAKLSEHEQFIIKSIYFDGMKQVELAKKLGISKVSMSQKNGTLNFFTIFVFRNKIKTDRKRVKIWQKKDVIR